MSRLGRLLAPVYFLALSGLAFYYLVRCGFIVYDDAVYVYQNPKIMALAAENFLAIFLTGHAYGYTPLPLVTYALEFALVGLAPWLYHATNIFLHGLTAYAAYLLFLRLTASPIPSWLAASLFAVHPLQTETVAWISIRKGILGLLFFLISALLYLDPKPLRSRGRYILSAACFALSLLSMMYALLLPLVFWVAERSRLCPKRPLMDHVPFWVLSWMTLIIWMRSHPASAHAGPEAFSPDRILLAADALTFYLTKLVSPTGLSLFYPRPDASVMPLAACALLAALAFFMRRRAPLFSLGAAFFFLGILPLLPFFDHTHSATQDHYAYVASVGVFLILAWVFRAVFIRGNTAACALILIGSVWVAGYGLASQRQSRVWKDTESVAAQTLRHYPDLAPAYFIRGEHFRALGQTQRALDDLNEAIRLRPEIFIAYEYRAKTYAGMGRTEEAARDMASSRKLQSVPGHKIVY